MSREKSEAMNNYIHWNVNIYILKKQTENYEILILCRFERKKNQKSKKNYYSTIILIIQDSV